MRIMVIEDEQKVSALVKRGLTAERYAVDICADGIEGLEYFEAFPYDLIILDLMLPRLPGTEVLQRIRRKNDHVPILISHRQGLGGRQGKAVRAGRGRLPD